MEDRQITVVYDKDDVLNNLFDYVLTHLEPWENRPRWVNYRVSKNGIDNNRIEKIYALYNDTRTFEEVGIYEDCKRILDIEKKYSGVKVRVYSNILNKPVEAVKRKRLMGEVDGFTSKHFVGNYSEYKPPYDGADIVVEDCLENIMMYTPKVWKILIGFKEYNRLDEHLELIRGKDISRLIVVPDLKAAIDIVEDLVSRWRMWETWK